jgi:hypothetical protein
VHTGDSRQTLNAHLYQLAQVPDQGTVSLFWNLLMCRC